jgi:hypothetical protein
MDDLDIAVGDELGNLFFERGYEKYGPYLGARISNRLKEHLDSDSVDEIRVIHDYILTGDYFDRNFYSVFILRKPKS